ncbi:MAG: molybdopterin molybdotransferase MoeA [Phycisphaerales bacterium]|nr:molybdopterin molybdotransferase MoeA [Phycisphaerales bacterium]
MEAPITLAAIETAQTVVLRHVSTLGTERVPLADALDRVTAEPVVCDTDYPPFDKSMMDGFAIHDPSGQTRFHIVGQVAAGSVFERALAGGEAVQINTGAAVPPGTTAVVPVENVEIGGGGSFVSIRSTVMTGAHVESRGRYVHAGDVVITAGQRMTPARMAVAAAVGAAEVVVYRRPRVAILVTGNELVDVSQTPGPGRIRNSNGPMLNALLRSDGISPVDLGACPDERPALRERMARGLDADVFCISGGVSMGTLDLVPEVLAGLGVQVMIRKWAIRPGKPGLFGVHQSGCRVFALAGNPVGCFVAYWLLVRPAIRVMCGLPGGIGMLVSARLDGRCPATADRAAFLPARLALTDAGEWRVALVPWNGSGDLFGFGAANALVARPPHTGEASAGADVRVHPLEHGYE